MTNTIIELQQELDEVKQHCLFLNEALNGLFQHYGCHLPSNERAALLNVLEVASKKHPPLV